MLLVFSFYSLLVYSDREIHFSAPFLKGYVTKALEEKVLNHQISISSVEVSAFSKLSKLNLKLGNFKLIGQDDQSLIDIEAIDIEFNFFDLIFPNSRKYFISLSSIPIRIERKLDNKVSLMLGKYEVLNKEILGSSSIKVIGNISLLRFNNPKIELVDEVTKISIRPDIEQIKLNNLNGYKQVTLEASLRQNGFKPASLKFEAKFLGGSHTTQVKSVLKNFVPSQFFNFSDGPTNFLNKIKSPISGSLFFSLDQNKNIQSSYGSFNGKSLKIERLSTLTNDLKINELSFDFSSNHETSSVQLQNISIDSSYLISSGIGEIKLGKTLNLKLSLLESSLLLNLKQQKPLQLLNSNLEFDVDIAAGSIVLKQSSVYHNNTETIAEGYIHLANQPSKRTQFFLKLVNVDSLMLDHYNFGRGKVVTPLLRFIDKLDNFDLEFAGTLNNLVNYEFDGSLEFKEAQLNSFSHVGKVLVRDGKISFNSSQVSLAVQEILVEKESRLITRLKNLSLEIINIPGSPALVLRSDFRGQIVQNGAHLVDLIKDKMDIQLSPNFIMKNYISEDVIIGDIEVKLLDFNALQGSAKSLFAKINFKNLNINVPFFKKSTIISEIKISASKYEMGSTITGLVDNMPFEGYFKKVFIRDVASTLQVFWKTSINDFKPYLPNQFNYSSDGLVKLEVNIVFPPDQSPIFRLKGDITDSYLNVPSIGFRKEEGDFGEFEIGAVEGYPANFYFFSNDYELSGLIFFHPNKKFKKFEIQKVKLGDYFQGNATYTTSSHKNKLLVNGTMYNYLKAPKFKIETQEIPLSIIASFAKLTISENLDLDRFIGEFRIDEMFKGSGSGNLNGGPEVTIDLTISDKKKKLEAYSNNAGDVLMKSDIYSSGYGGEIYFDLTKRLNQAAEGTIRVTNMKVLGAPFLAKLVALTSIEGILDALGSNGMIFNDIKANFSFDKNFLTITKGVAVNPSLGITLSGTREMKSKMINYSGVVSPAYSLNRMVKKLPLIGNMLGGAEGEGAFGISYFSSGTIDRPTIAVNPLSIITPGQFRNLLK